MSSHPIATKKRFGGRGQGGDFERLFSQNTTLTLATKGVKTMAWGCGDS